MHTSRTFSKEELKDRATKALKLNGFDYYDTPSSYPISDPNALDIAKPTITIKRLKRGMPIARLNGASAIQNQLKREKERAEKALKLNGCI